MALVDMLEKQGGVGNLNDKTGQQGIHDGGQVVGAQILRGCVRDYVTVGEIRNPTSYRLYQFPRLLCSEPGQLQAPDRLRDYRLLVTTLYTDDSYVYFQN